jgi:hypothetical protein
MKITALHLTHPSRDPNPGSSVFEADAMTTTTPRHGVHISNYVRF